jgi:hypothetical protein
LTADGGVRNTDVEISLLLPTRGRVPLVQRLFGSVVETSTDPGRLEVVLYVDEDDAESREISHPGFSIVKIVGQPGRTMGSMNRACYDASRGRYVMLINDDAVFRTPGWDARVLEAAARHPDDIALIYGNDLDQGEAVPTFPLVSRIVCDVLGEICPRGYRHLHIESHLLDIFKQLARLGHDRVCYLEDVIFEHLHPMAGKGAMDSTYAKKSQRLDDILFIALDEERAFKAKLLARHIEVYRHNISVGAGAKYDSAPELRSNQSLGLVARLRRRLPFL